MRDFTTQGKRTQRPLQWAMTAAIFTALAGLGGCAYGHHDHDDYGRPAAYIEHDEGWHREHDGDRSEHHDLERHDEEHR